MVSNLEELGSLLDENNLTTADIEYIVKFMQTENISPQLAMRRIKAFDSLKSKLENNDEKEKISLLEEELMQIKNQLVEKNELLHQLNEEKSGLENQKMELESKSELIDSEREELQRQLEMIKEMQFSDDDNAENDSNDKNDPLKDKLVVLVNDLEQVQNKGPVDLMKILNPIKASLQKIIDNEESNLDGDTVIATFREISASNVKSNETPSKISNVTSTPSSNQEKLVDEMKESMSEKSKMGENKGQEVKKPEKKITEKEEQVLNLFLEFITEADSDAGFKERVSTICDMDEAYQYLGSIGLSQMYSFSSRGIEKKEELIQLLNSWKKEGIPR